MWANTQNMTRKKDSTNSRSVGMVELVQQVEDKTNRPGRPVFTKLLLKKPTAGNLHWGFEQWGIILHQKQQRI